MTGSSAGQSKHVNHGNYLEFRYEIEDPDTSTSSLKIVIPPGQNVRAIRSNIFALSSTIQCSPTKRYGEGDAISGDACFSSSGHSDWIMLSTERFCTIVPVNLNNEMLYIGYDVILAVVGNIKPYEPEQQKKNANLFSRKRRSPPIPKMINGSGIVFFCLEGARTIELKLGETVSIEREHLVSCSSSATLDFPNPDTDNVFVTPLSITGPATVLVQLRRTRLYDGL